MPTLTENSIASRLPNNFIKYLKRRNAYDQFIECILAYNPNWDDEIQYADLSMWHTIIDNSLIWSETPYGELWSRLYDECYTFHKNNRYPTFEINKIEII